MHGALATILRATTLGIMLPGAAVAATLAWDPPPDTTGIDGYRIQCGATGAKLSASVEVPGTDSTQADIDLAPGEWYCVAQSYAGSGEVSEYSEQVVFRVLSPPDIPDPSPPLPAPISITVIIQGAR
jgi:hypothetical protein